MLSIKNMVDKDLMSEHEKGNNVLGKEANHEILLEKFLFRE